jgi:hypothetical protein
LRLHRIAESDKEILNLKRRYPMNRITFLLIIVPLLRGQYVSADMGGIPYNPKALLFEPNQNAAIGFNGSEEILLLSTNLYASEQTKVLEVLPLPSEPKVTKGDIELFKKATDLINRRRQIEFKGGAGGMGGLGGGDAAPPAAVVTFQEKIGAHEITVVNVKNQKGFIDWVEDHLRKGGVENPTIAEPMKQVIGEYLQSRCRWFVFDVVELTKETKTKDAIQYRFPTKVLYYPLRITRAGSGDTHIQLLIFSNKLHLLPKSGGLRVRLLHDPLPITSAELQELGNRDFADLLKNHQCILRIWDINGPLSSFKTDIAVH